MFDRLSRIIRAMELEERVLHVGGFVCLVGLFLPWLAVGTYGESQVWASGFGFRTGYIGHSAFLLSLFLASITLSPLFGGPVIVRKPHRHVVRLLISATILVVLLCAFSVLLRVTFEVSGAEIRFGVYVALVGSALSTLYAFLKYQEIEGSRVRSLFHHPDEPTPALPNAPDDEQEFTPPPPPPPTPPPAEDHHIFSKSL